MVKSAVLATFLATTALFGASAAQAATTLSVGPTSLCGEAGCFGANNTYTHTFSAADFKGMNAISQLRVDKALVGSMKDYVVKISFTKADGTVVSNWGGWVLAVLGGDVVTLSGPGFDWDTDFGDLVLNLELVVPGKSGAGGQGLSLGGGGGPPFGDGFPGLGHGPPASSGPPPFMTQEDTGHDIGDAVFLVPEPSTWALMLLGFGAMGAMLRRARRLRSVVPAQPCG